MISSRLWGMGSSQCRQYPKSGVSSEASAFSRALKVRFDFASDASLILLLLMASIRVSRAHSHFPGHAANTEKCEFAIDFIWFHLPDL